MRHSFDVVVVGSGFGGTMIAKKLLDAGLSVAIIERGDYVRRGPHNWADNGSIDLTPHYDKSLPYEVIKGGNKKQMGVYSAVGGPSLFYGGVSFRFREEDFHPPEDIVGMSGAAWPIHYHDLEPYYCQAEQLLGVAGESGVDPSEPPRSQPFPQTNAPYAKVSQHIKAAAEAHGCKPFHLPLAINYTDKDRALCQRCTTCDTFACAVEAKNDLEVMLIRGMCAGGLTLLHNTIVSGIEYDGHRATAIQCLDKKTDEHFRIHASAIVVSAGALGSPHLLLNSQLDQIHPSGSSIGRYLMRHTNAIVFGIYPSPPDKEQIFHKELAIMDYYLGHKDIEYPKSKIGSLQQVPTPPAGLVRNALPNPIGTMLSSGTKLLTGLLAIAEDQPQYGNYIQIDPSRKAAYGMCTPIVSHEYTKRDLDAVQVLIDQAKIIMKKAGAWTHYVHHIRTFSHAVGTVRMGIDPNTSPLDQHCRLRGLDNLYVVDASFMPTSAAVNPSLTISANALRVGDHIADLMSSTVR